MFFFKKTGTGPKENPAYNLGPEKILINFFKSEPCR